MPAKRFNNNKGNEENNRENNIKRIYFRKKFSQLRKVYSKQYDTETEVYNATVLDMSFIASKYDAIYCYNVLHLFRENDRKLFLRECLDRLKEQGLVFFTVFSDEEPSFEQGKEVEKNTFEIRPGRPVHYYSEDDLIEQFHDFNIIETGSMYDPEDHGGQAHTHILRYILARE